MHVLPLALPALLPAMIATESVKLKLLLNASVSEQLRESMSRTEMKCWARLRFDTRGNFKDLTVGLDRRSPEDFPVQVTWNTFASARYSLEEAVVREWLNRAVTRRMAFGRELAHLDDDALQGLLERCRVFVISATLSTTHLQEAFLGLLARAEIEERKRAGSKHRTLQAVKQAKPLLALLDAERAHAESEDAPHFDICGSNRRADTKLPGETQRIYDYRAYHDERREGFPLFNIWGEPWPKRGRPKRTEASPKTEAAAEG